MEAPALGARARVALVGVVGCLVVFGVVASCAPRSTSDHRAAASTSGATGPSPRDVDALVSDPGSSQPSGGGPVADRSGPGGSTTTLDGPGSGGGADPGRSGPSVPGDATAGGAAPGSVPEASPADCAALQLVAIPAARIITAEDFVPLDRRTVGPGGAEVAAAATRVAVIVPPDARAAWVRAAAAIERAVAAGRHLSPEEWEVLRGARHDVAVWARAACPDAPPSWRCDAFGSVGPGPDVAPSAPEAATPLAALHRYPDTGRAVELERTADIVLYGWVDDAGFVDRTQQVERVGDGWATARRHVCHGGG